MMPILSDTRWDEFLENYPDTHILQTSSWGKLKSAFGWEPVHIANRGAGAQILFKKLPAGLSVGYIPKGPVGMDFSDLFAEIDDICKKQNAIFLKVEPDDLDDNSVSFLTHESDFRLSNPIQPRRTILIDLDGNESEWLERMKQKTRYNIKLAEKKGIVIQASDNLNEFYGLMTTTGQRDGFGIHSLAYYQKAYQQFNEKGNCILNIAYFDGKPLAGLMAFSSGKRAWYLYGASNDEERQRMPTYLLQWETMRWAAAKGCSVYDLWGVPDYDEEKLEEEFSNRGDGLWGVYRFKRGFGGRLTRSAGAWDKVYKPLLYKLYQFRMRGREI